MKIEARERERVKKQLNASVNVKCVYETVKTVPNCVQIEFINVPTAYDECCADVAFVCQVECGQSKSK